MSYVIRNKFFCLSMLLLTLVVVSYSDVLDIVFSNYFFHNYFYLRQNQLISFVDHNTTVFVVSLYVVCLYHWIRYKFFKAPSFINTAKIKFLTICLLGWCIALVHLIKFIFGRRRPQQVIEFNGDFHFSSLFEMSNQCVAGCSFVSGHTGLILWTLALALIMPAKYKIVSVIAALSMSAVVAFTRVAGGYHFFTDVYFCFVIIIPLILYTYKKCKITVE